MPPYSSLPQVEDGPRVWTEITIPYANKEVFERNGPGVLLTDGVLKWLFESLDAKEEWFVVHSPSQDSAAFSFLNANDAMRFKLTWSAL